MNEQPDAYIWVNGWEKFQTYSKRRGKPWAPPWIKVYASLWEKDEFLRLPVPSRLMLLGIFNAFATTRGRLANDTRTLSRRLDQRVTNTQLLLLNHAGFIAFCSETVREQRWNSFINCSSLELELEVEVDPSVQPIVRPQQNGRTEGAIAFDYQNILQDMQL